MTALGLQIDDVAKTFGRHDAVAALDGVTIDVKQGDVLVLLGPSGCGKSTLLRCIAGLETPDRGVIRIGDHTVFDATNHHNTSPSRRDVGMVFQNYALWPHMTVQQNVAYPLKVRGVRASERNQRAMTMLTTVRCDQLAGRYPSELSGGQQQRVALARSLVADPRVVLFDEPLSNIDAQLRQDLRAELRTHQRALGFTAIYVTHDQIEAFEIGTVVAVMRDGEVRQIGRPQDVHERPASIDVAEFLAVDNRLSAHWTSAGWRLTEGTVVGPLTAPPPASAGTVCFRAECVRLADSRQATASMLQLGDATVVDVLVGGSTALVRLRLGETEVRMKTDSATAIAMNAEDTVRVAVDLSAVLVYDDHGVLMESRAVPHTTGEPNYAI